MPQAVRAREDVPVVHWLARLLRRRVPAARAGAPVRPLVAPRSGSPAGPERLSGRPHATGPTLDDGGGPWRPRWADLPPVPATLPPVRAVPPRGAAPRTSPAPVTDRPVPRPIAGAGLPWSAVGRVDVPGGWGSGVLVGPRHVLTASHVVAWGRGVRTHPEHDAPGWLRFTPAARPGHAPHGVADGVAVHYALAVAPPVIEPFEERYDYAICVLDRRIGDEVGWLGVRGYDDEWDGEPLWTLVGYRGPTAAQAEPVALSGLELDGHDEQSDDSQVIFHPAAMAVGSSGGPVLAQWPGEPVPSVVAVQSWSNEHRSGACGGHRLVELVARALREHP